METERLILRRLAIDDTDALHAIQSDPVTMKFYPEPFTREKTEGWIRRTLESYEKNGYGRWAVVLREGGEMIGDCGIIPSVIDGVPENDLGYIIHHRFQGRGLATEAARACVDYWLGLGTGMRLCANMAADHLASQRVAEKVGMRRVREFLNPRNRNLLTYLYVTGDDR